MSMFRAKDELTTAIIKSTLSKLAKDGKTKAINLISITEKQFPRKLKKLLKGKGGDKEIARILSYLRSRGYIKRLYGRGRDSTYNLTTSGWRRLEDLRWQPLADRVKSWDGKWRVVIFDIPESKREVRDSFRRQLTHLGFKQLKRSVWVHPLSCEEEIGELKAAYDIGDHLMLLTVEGFDKEAEYKKLFSKELKSVK